MSLDASKSVFLTSYCKGARIKEVRNALTEHKFPAEKIIREMDMSKLRSGDYLIRCFDGSILAWEIRPSHLVWFTTIFLGNL